MAIVTARNSSNLTGNVTRDPKYIEGDGDKQDVVYFDVAVDRYPGKDDSPTDFFPVAMYGKRAKGLSENLVKGSRVHVFGGLRSKREEIGDTARTIVTIVAEDVDILTWPKNDSSQSAEAAPTF